MYHLKQKNFKKREFDIPMQFEFDCLQQEDVIVDGVVVSRMVTNRVPFRSDPDLKYQDFSIANLSASGAIDKLRFVQLSPDGSSAEDVSTVNARLEEFAKVQSHEYAQTSPEDSQKG